MATWHTKAVRKALKKFSGCVCDKTTGRVCQFHARQPNACPANCGGQLNYQPSGKRVRGRAVAGPTRNCNKCEHCQ